MHATMSDMSSKPKGYYSSVREDMIGYIPAHAKRTLEFGCGTGGFSAMVKEKLGVEAWAVEIDKESAKAASERLDKVICDDAHKAVDLVPDDYFDCIIFFDILEHLIDPDSLLTQVKTKLAKDGVIAASIPNVRYYRALVQLVVHGNWDYKDHGILDRTHLRFFTHKSIVKMFDALDYRILQMEGIHPTSSRTFKILNVLLLNSISDVRYKHFAVVAKPG